MRKKFISLLLVSIACLFVLIQCAEKQETDTSSSTVPDSSKVLYGGYGDQVKWGEHLVAIGGCNDCHTPKKMTPHGPDIDSSLLLAGYNGKTPVPDVSRKEMEAKGLAVTMDLTSWVGPWGISYAANLTSDNSGIGGWQEEQFIYALRQGKSKGLANSRPILPPMPWQMFKHMSDDEIKAIFAYLKSTKPIANVVPAPAPPSSVKQ